MIRHEQTCLNVYHLFLTQRLCLQKNKNVKIPYQNRLRQSIPSAAEMTTKLQHIQNLRRIYQKSVESVRPHNLISAANGYSLKPKVSRDSATIQIQGKTLDLRNKRCHVVGFGKAVLGMAVKLEKELACHLAGGIISIPRGSLQQFRDVEEMQLSVQTNIKVYEGAPNNQPDEVALEAATAIKQLALSMAKNDILFVLISGGGSALLPLPKVPLTLDEKMQLIRNLANRGASIDEMNLVRIALSDIKGGRLAAAAKNAHSVVSFVISDIVGDPVDLIASGPTCAAFSKRWSACDVLKKYEMWDTLPVHIQEIVQTIPPETETQPGRNNTIYVVGDNRVATATAVQAALDCGYNPFIASTTITGDVLKLVSMYTVFLRSICSFRRKDIDEDQLRQEFPFDTRIFQHFLKTLLMCEKTGKPLLLILAGEPTVKITGSGLGGRNQELALRMSKEFYENPEFNNISFLSAGTDGIDGPTPAAGAVGSNLVIEDHLSSRKSLTDLNHILLNNDSYNFYKQLKDGHYHIITGHTGTNVMDLQLLLVP